MRPLFVLSALFAFAATASAQDRPASVIEAQPAPVYPAVLRAARISGTVTALVRVLPGDSAPDDGVVILAAPHPGFQHAVREALRHWRYRSAVVDGTPRPDSLTIELVFTLLPSDTGQRRVDGSDLPPWFDSVEVSPPVQHERRSWRITLGRYIPSGPGVVPRDSVWRAMAVLAVGKLQEEFRAGPSGAPRISCLTFQRGSSELTLTLEELQRMQRPGTAVVARGRCPPTYTSMAYVQGRIIPPGEDPTKMTVTEVLGWDDRWYKVRVVWEAGTSGRSAECYVDVRAIDSRTYCAPRGQWVY